MSLLIPDTVDFWEVVAGLSIAQQHKLSIATKRVDATLLGELMGLNCYCIWSSDREDKFAFGDAYRRAENNDSSYHHNLANESGLTYEPIPPSFTSIPAGEGGGIVFCPFGIVKALELPFKSWRFMIRMLRQFNVPLRLLSSANKRMDDGNFAESDYLYYRPIQEQLTALANADLVIGVPNEWLWLATAWKKKIIYFVPDGIPWTRWFPYSQKNHVQVSYDPHALQNAVILATVTKGIKVLNTINAI